MSTARSGHLPGREEIIMSRIAREIRQVTRAGGPNPKGTPMRGRRGTVAAAFLAVTVASGCSGAGTETGAAADADAGTGSGTAGATGTVTVMAPAPLKGALDKAKAAYESQHAGTSVTVNYGHIPALLTQISQGVPADVLVTPDEATMTQVRAKGVVADGPVAVARNELVLVVPSTNPAGVKDVTALGNEQLTVIVCAPELPCGKLTSQLATKAGVSLVADSQEPGGSPAVVTKVASGEADLGVSFATDTKAGGTTVRVIPLDGALGASTTVTAAAVASPANAPGAGQFLAFLSSPDGKALFTEAGFSPL